MTEYDYSPDAYERYLSTQERIARWVHQTEEHRPQFDSGESRKPSFFQRIAQRTRRHSYHEPRHRDSSPSSSSSSSSSTPGYSTAPHAPGPMTYHSPPVASPHSYPQHRPSHARHQSHHTSSYRAPVYMTSPPISPPVQSYQYSYGTTPNPGHYTSPGPYTYPTYAGANPGSTPPNYYQQTTSYFPPHAGYSMSQAQAQAYTQRPPLNHSPQSLPISNYGQTQAMTSPPAQPYPYSAFHSPPPIYPMSYGPQQQQLPQKPVFYQRIFSGSSRSGKRKGSSRRGS